MAKQEKNSGWKDYIDVVNDLKNDTASRVYLICGEEKYLVDKTIADMKKRWVSPGAESLDFYLKDQTNSEMPLDEFQSLVGSPPFMSKYRMTVIRNLGLWANRAPSSASDVEKWKAAISSIPEFSAVIFVEDKVDKRKKQLLEAVSGVGTLAEFSFQNEETLTKWIKSSFARKNITTSPICISSLISRTDSSMRMIESEVTKIMLYCENKGVKELNMDLLNRLSIPDVHASVFNMTDAIGNRQPGKALEILNDLITLKEAIPKIRLMLARHIRHLICAKEIGNAPEIASRLKVHPFVAKNLVSQSRGFTIAQLEKIYMLCFESDQWVKTGKMDDRTSMEVLLSACGQV
ncbi:MAG: DNA polymerase III subunit delta [Clostridiales bacterium]|nr:DNA polymerase III subunit delta [Clostridiales bacterium]